MLEIFTPLFCEMEELGQTLDAEEFVDASGRLFETLTIPERNTLISFKHKWEENKKRNTDEYQFRPNLNNNSLRIAEKCRPSGENVADLLVRKKQEYETKVVEK